MAQNFRRYRARNVGTTAVDLLGGAVDSFDCIISIRMANILSSTINPTVYVTSDSQDYRLIKDVPILPGGSLELIDGGSKIVLANGDQLFAQSDTNTSIDIWVSAVDDIST